jgi:hypothetical protein
MNKPYNYFSAILIISIASTFTACNFLEGNNSKPTGDMVCDKSNREIFYNCLIQYVPLGSSYEELKKFLILHDFSYSYKNPFPEKNYEFYFIWSANNIANYKIGVIGYTNSDFKVIEMEMI